MDYILRKFKYKHKREAGQQPEVSGLTHNDDNTDSNSSKFELKEHLSLQSSPLRLNQLTLNSDKTHCNHRQSRHSSLYSSYSSPSPSRSSDSSDGTDHNLNISAVTKLLLNRPVRVRRSYQSESFLISDNSFAIDCLNWHNLFRAKHGSPPLSISYLLVNMAQEWANYLAHTDSYKYRNSEGIGENLMCKWTCHPDFDPKGETIVKFWYSEIDLYNYSIDPSIMHTLANHFTQIVWKSTQEFGIGKAHTRGGKLIVVANYKPAGNIIGLFHKNVFPLIRDNNGKIEDSDSLCATPTQSQNFMTH